MILYHLYHINKITTHTLTFQPSQLVFYRNIIELAKGEKNVHRYRFAWFGQINKRRKDVADL